ncbi:MAG: T9SS type A sorting domain-containing protein [Ignavibacteria bacterium]|nr:T9SS type A sorting domain-containing protein [Ignavibacteria bacterium]
MKRIIPVLLLMIILSSASNSMAQGFTYRNLEPVYIQLPYIPDSTQVVQRRAIVSSTSSSPINFRFARIVNEMPANWYTQMCYDLCYAPFVDTISLPFDPPYVLQPNQTDTLFYIDFSCSGQGLGTAIVRMYNTDNPSQYIQDTFKVEVGGVGITNISSVVEGYDLSQNYPNPFNPSTTITFSIPKSEEVTLRIYNSLGQIVQTVINGDNLSAGKYRVDFSGENLTSGIYYYTIASGTFSETKKMLLIK